MQTNLKDFSGESIYVGIDSHLKSWNVTIMSAEMELRNFTQEPDSKKLSAFLRRNYPGANYTCVYEAGFAGFTAQRALIAEGISCMVIHPADVPTSDKEKRQKRDRVDSRKLARGLKNQDLDPIYIPDLEQQQDRSLLRVNDKLTRDITRGKNRIKSFLMFFGIAVPKEFDDRKWTKGFMVWLEEVRPGGEADRSFGILVSELQLLKQQEKVLDKQIKSLSEQPRYKERVVLLTSIPGVGIQTAMILLTEIGDINRFPISRRCALILAWYLTAMIAAIPSGQAETLKRGNVYLKYILIEVSWMCIRYDPSLLLVYKSAIRTMEGNKAIIRVARKLLNRVRYVLKNNKPYEVLGK